MIESLGGLKFLVVDDVLPTRRVVKRILTTLEVALSDILERENAESAIDILAIQPDVCDVIISDFRLGELTGLDLLEFVRNKPELRFLPFVLISNDLQRDDFLKAKSLGVSSCLLKPLSIGNVLEHVQEGIKVERIKMMRSSSLAQDVTD